MYVFGCARLVVVVIAVSVVGTGTAAVLDFIAFMSRSRSLWTNANAK
jgi:hypothetical protein